jgi:hypothetical protein
VFQLRRNPLHQTMRRFFVLVRGRHLYYLFVKKIEGSVSERKDGGYIGGCTCKASFPSFLSFLSFLSYPSYPSFLSDVRLPFVLFGPSVPGARERVFAHLRKAYSAGPDRGPRNYAAIRYNRKVL